MYMTESKRHAGIAGPAPRAFIPKGKTMTAGISLSTIVSAIAAKANGAESLFKARCRRDIRQSSMRVCACIVALLTIMVGRVGWAATYTFTEIARARPHSPGETAFGEFPTAPAINSLGVVAFNAHGVREGIYTGAGGPITTIAETGDGGFVDLSSASAMNTAGQIAFHAVTPSSIGIFRSDGVTTTTIASSVGGFVNVGPGYPSINSSGAVAFSGNDGFSDGLFIGGAGGPPTAMYRPGDFGHIYASDPAINDAGELSFVTDAGSSTMGVGHGDGGPPLIVGDGYSSLSHTSISPGGTVAFRATSFGAPADAIWTGYGSASATVLADNEGPFSAFESEAAISATTIAFMAQLDAGGSGIYTGADSIADKVLQTGDWLFGEAVAGFPGYTSKLNRFAVNDAGQIAFQAQLGGGDVVVVRADPVTLPDGDRTFDGIVDAADYVALRKITDTPEVYADWREHFGEIASLAAADASSSHGAVPEPAGGLLLVLGVALCGLRRCRFGLKRRTGY
jgi:hypothetical protein